jgi:cation:H+ antiporter
MGTSAPEFVISVTASARGSNALAIGNIVGSNIFNLIFIIGLCAVIAPMAVKVQEIQKDFWLSIVAAVLLLALKFAGGDVIPRSGSFLLVAIFATYMFFVVRKAVRQSHSHSDDEEENSNKKVRSVPVHILFAIFGLGLIIGGGHLTVESAARIAYEMRISERIIGLTVIAIGTSLPELVICLVACKKGENEFALGNIIGSNIFNILFILGVAGLITPLEIDAGLTADTIFLIAGSLLMILFVYTKRKISRPEGAIMVALYLAYMTVAVTGISIPIIW